MNFKAILIFLVGAVMTQLTQAFNIRMPHLQSRMSRVTTGALNQITNDCSTALSGWCGPGDYRYDYGRFLDALDKEIRNKEWNNNNNPRPPPVVQSSFMPMDIKESNETYKIYIDLPGIPKSDIEIKVKGDELTISAKREPMKKEDESERFLAHERKGGKYQRTFALPDNADRTGITAESHDGVLELVIPKLPEKIEQEVAIEIR